MKRCPNCNRSYTDEALNFCLEDGTPLVREAAIPLESSETRRYVAPPTEIYRPSPASNPSPPPAMVNHVPQHQGQWSPMPPPQARKSSAVWWILGGLAVLVVIGVGALVMFLALASISSQSNSNRVVLSNTNTNRNTNSNRWSNTNASRENSNSTASLPSSCSDDFSNATWTVVSSSEYGDFWYDNDQYHMRSKAGSYVVTYAPTDDYDTENATVTVTARNVDGVSPGPGYGLVVHGKRSRDDKLEDYAFLIFTGPNPQYKVLMHKGGTETKLVDWTPSNVIRKGTSTNELEVRIKGSQLAFSINGQLVTAVSDTGNFRRGRAGLYTSDAHEVAFDDLEITR